MSHSRYHWLERADRWAVWGLGRSGLAAANALAALGKSVLVSDPRELSALGDYASKLADGVDLHAGANVLADAQALVVSPGLKPSLEVFDLARHSRIPVLPEIELAYELSTAEHLAITGTDGKTTTTSLLGAMVAEAGIPHAVAGNIGTPLCEVAADVPSHGIIVAEVSAFQLWSTTHWRASASAITNLAGDHLDYFDGDFDAYADAKRAILAHAREDDWAVLWAEDPVVSSWGAGAPCRVAYFSESAPAHDQPNWIWQDGHALRARWDGEDAGVWLEDVRELRIKGAHNVRNVMAAGALAMTRGVDVGAIARAALAFSPLAHRMEPVRTLAGITYWDDSKATNAHAAMTGLAGLDGAVVPILGGVDKGLDLVPLTDLVAARAPAAVLIGEAAERLASELERAGMSAERIHRAAYLETAVEAARELALEHRAPHVSLSPACSSFDMFSSYAERGEIFQRLVQALS